MAQRRRPTSRSSGARRGRTTRRTRGGGLPMPRISLGLSPAVVRSLVGIFLLVLGAVTLIALVLPGEGALTDWWRNLAVPYFGSGRWLLPFVLLLSGWYVEWGPGREPGAPWGRTLLGIAMAYAGFLGLAQLTGFSGEFTGGRIGRFLVNVLEPALTTPGAFVILLGMLLAGLLITFDMPLRALIAPATHAARAAGAALQGSGGAGAQGSGTRAAPKATNDGAGAAGVGVEGGRRGRAIRLPGGEAPGQTGVWGTEQPAAVGPGGASASPTSATFAPARGNGSGAGVAVGPGIAAGAGVAAAAGASATGAAGAGLAGAAVGNGDAGLRAAARESRPIGRDPEDVTDASDSPPKQGVEWRLPPHMLLDAGEAQSPTANQDAIHAWNEDRIIEKLSSFDIEARIIARNAGPVVTQYEVQPAPHIKLSRIEALSDDLSMALAARSIRIEAPIPGKSAVGIEIPNREFNVVALRRILDEVDFSASGSRLTFALGRDVAGRAQAVDLSKMPHLLIAGATGSGKSVMVNALITSLLCNATPDDARMILMDLKRVELAGYNGLPHLLVPVITEPDRAKAALKWAVGEMENRYRRFAGATARNIKAFNETRIDPADRLPYIVIVVDELADLMMREGKNVEDPIVRLAQKARATGHPHGPGHAAPVGERRHGPDQGQLPEPDRVRDGVPDRQPHDPRCPGGRGPDRPRRHALPAVRPAASDAPPGRVRVGCRDRAGRRALARPDRGPALRPLDHRVRRGVDGLGGRPGRRGRGSPAPGCRIRHPGVRSCFGVAAAAPAADRLRPGSTDHRPARGPWIRRGVRRLECPGGPSA